MKTHDYEVTFTAPSVWNKSKRVTEVRHVTTYTKESAKETVRHNWKGLGNKASIRITSVKELK